MKINLNPNELTYLNLKIVDTITINYDISSYPSCQISVVCTELQKIELETRLDDDSLPYFLGYFKIDSITFIEEPEHLNPLNIYKATISFRYFLMDNLEKTFNLQIPFPSSRNTDTTKPNEVPISVSSVKNIILEAPIKHYRFLDVRQNTNYVTTAGDEVNYLINTYGLILNQRKLRKGVIELVSYGKKISEIEIPSNTITSRERSAVTRINNILPPTIIWKGVVGDKPPSLLNSVSENTLNATCFDIGTISTTSSNDFEIVQNNSSPSSPYNSLNPFTSNFLTPPLTNAQSSGIHSLGLTNFRDLFTIQNTPPNNPLSPFSEPLTSLLSNTPRNDLSHLGNSNRILNYSGEISRYTGDSEEGLLSDNNLSKKTSGTSFKVRKRNSEITLISGSQNPLEPEDNNFNSFAKLHKNGGTVKKRTVQKFKNGRLLSVENTEYGYATDFFTKDVASSTWQVIKQELKTINYRIYQHLGWKTKYYTEGGYTLKGWMLEQLQTPSLSNTDNIDFQPLKEYWEATLGNPDSEISSKAASVFKLVKLPYSEVETLKYAPLSFLPEFKHQKKAFEAFNRKEESETPAEYVVERVVVSDNRSLTEIEGRVLQMGTYRKIRTVVDFITVSAKPEEYPHTYRTSTYEVMIQSVQGRPSNRIVSSEVIESTDINNLIAQYTKIENPYGGTSSNGNDGDNDIDKEKTTDLLIFSKNQKYLYNPKVRNIYSDSSIPVKKQLDAVKTYLSLNHLNLIKNNYTKTITILGNIEIYPADTVKYKWKDTIEGGLVLSVQHTLQILPQNFCKWLTIITFSDYSFNDYITNFTFTTRVLND